MTLLVSMGAFAQGNGIAGISEATNMVTSYFDPGTSARLDGLQTMADYYRPFVGKIHVLRYELLEPQVVIDGHMDVVMASRRPGTMPPGGALLEGGIEAFSAAIRRTA